jgi:hypothetical protein
LRDTASALLAAERHAARSPLPPAPHRRLGGGLLASGVGIAVGADLLVPAAIGAVVAGPVAGCCLGLAVAGSYLMLRTGPPK